MDFAKLYDTNETEMLNDAYEAITRCGLWDWLKAYKSHRNEGFMFATDIELAILRTSLRYPRHSGRTFAWTMSVMEDIAKNGWDKHKKVTY